jgi:hypothetical protein
MQEATSTRSAVRQTGDAAHRVAAQVANSEGGDRAARVGLGARTVVYVLLGYLVARIALGALGQPGSSRPATAQGAAQAIAAQTGGRVVVFVLAVCLLLFAFFSVIDALLHHNREREDWKRWALRALSWWTVLVYTAFSVYCLVTAFGNTKQNKGQSDKQPTEWSARVLRWPLGQVWLFVGGLIALTTAVVLTIMAFRRSFAGELERHKMSVRAYRAAIVLGITGYLGRATLFSLVGWFVCKAAITEDPNHGEGVDGSLRILAASTFGPVLLWLIAVTLVAYGVYLAFEARYRRV